MEPKIIGERIKNLIKEKKVTKEYVAKRIGITNKKLENKLEGKEEFYISEIIELTKIFNLNIINKFLIKDIKIGVINNEK